MSRIPTKIEFYDLSSTSKPEFWSPNTGKIRMLLNYTQIPYELKWLRYPDIEPALKFLGVKSWPEQNIVAKAAYTLPAVSFHYEDGSSETVMGADFFIVDKLIECYGAPIREKVFGNDEEFVRIFQKYDSHTSSLVYPAIGPFVYNIMEDDYSRDFYVRTREASNRGNMVELQKAPTEKFEKKLQAYTDEVTHFRLFHEIALENGATEDQLNRFEAHLTKFRNGDSPYILGDSPTYADFLLHTTINWCHHGMRGGCPKYDILGDRILKNWFERLSNYMLP